MFDLGIQELIVIFAVAIIVFGPKRLPELSRNLGRGIGQLKKALFDVKYEINREMNIMDEESGNAPGDNEPKWKKEALDAIYGGKGPAPGGVQGPDHGPRQEGSPPPGTEEPGEGGADKGTTGEGDTR
jgi:Tat protein translocase TatB subunit